MWYSASQEHQYVGEITCAYQKASQFFRSTENHLVAKPKDHKILFEWVNDCKQLEHAHKLEFTDYKKRIHRYEWVNNIPLKKFLGDNHLLFKELFFHLVTHGRQGPWNIVL